MHVNDRNFAEINEKGQILLYFIMANTLSIHIWYLAYEMLKQTTQISISKLRKGVNLQL